MAARQVFETHGYFDTKVADIARLTDASHGTFYTYFDSKDDALKALVTELADDLYVASTQPSGPRETPYLTLQATIRQFMHAYRDRAALLRILEQATSVSGATSTSSSRQSSSWPATPAVTSPAHSFPSTAECSPHELRRPAARARSAVPGRPRAGTRRRWSAKVRAVNASSSTC